MWNLGEVVLMYTHAYMHLSVHARVNVFYTVTRCFNSQLEFLQSVLSNENSASRQNVKLAEEKN